MSAGVKAATSATSAAKRIAQDLGVTNDKRLSDAIAIAAVGELDSNPRFAGRIRAAYDSLPPAPTRSRAATPKAPKVTLVPIKRVEGFDFNPGSPLNPYLAYEAFGVGQLHAALDLFSVPKLQDAARLVMERNQGTKPTNMRSKPALMEYIEQHITH